MSKFQNVMAEAAYAIAGHGFAEREMGSVTEPGQGPWQALVRVSRVLLLNIGESEMSVQYETYLKEEVNTASDAQCYVWIIEDTDGNVTVDQYCNADWMPDQIAVMDRDWEACEAHYDLDVARCPQCGTQTVRFTPDSERLEVITDKVHTTARCNRAARNK
jgi:hypothetical protein